LYVHKGLSTGDAWANTLAMSKLCIVAKLSNRPSSMWHHTGWLLAVGQALYMRDRLALNGTSTQNGTVTDVIRYIVVVKANLASYYLTLTHSRPMHRPIL